jgi:hypothetical protein
MYKDHHSVCPLVGVGILPTPLPQASVPPPRNKEWGLRGYTDKKENKIFLLYKEIQIGTVAIIYD